jgi:nucleoside-diphosphate-sugar epimerase
LTDGQKISKKDLFDAIADGLNLPRVTKVVPGAVAKTVCEIVSNIAPMLPEKTQRNLARYSRAAFRLAGINQGFSVAKAERELGYSDRISFTEGMGETLKAFKSAASQTQPQSANSGR